MSPRITQGGVNSFNATLTRFGATWFVKFVKVCKTCQAGKARKVRKVCKTEDAIPSSKRFVWFVKLVGL